MDRRPPTSRGGPPRQDATPGEEQDATPRAKDVAGLRELIEETERQRQAVQSALRRLEIPKPRRETARRLVLGPLLSDLATLSRLLRSPAQSSGPQLVANFRQILARLQQLTAAAERVSFKEGFYHPSYRETAWELVLELEVALLELEDAYLVARLREEQQRDRDPQAETRWSNFYDPAQLQDLLGALCGGERWPDGPPCGQSAVRRQAVEMLARLYEKRSDIRREDRAGEMLRVARVRWTCAFLGPAVLILAVLYGFVLRPDWGVWGAVRLVLLALVPAALGGTLGSIRRLREEPLVSRSGEQPRYRWAFMAQLLVSATLGLIVLALAVLEILPALQPPPGGTAIDWRDSQNLIVLSLYAFLAGFSEAFAINFLQRFMVGGAI